MSEFLTAKERQRPLRRSDHKAGSTRAMPLAIVVRPVVRDGEKPEELESERVKRAASELGGLGGKARAARMPPERRTEITRTAAAKRWNKPPRAESSS
jgi:hypothetical protein